MQKEKSPLQAHKRAPNCNLNARRSQGRGPRGAAERQQQQQPHRRRRRRQCRLGLFLGCSLGAGDAAVLQHRQAWLALRRHGPCLGRSAAGKREKELERERKSDEGEESEFRICGFLPRRCWRKPLFFSPHPTHSLSHHSPTSLSLSVVPPGAQGRGGGPSSLLEREQCRRPNDRHLPAARHARLPASRPPRARLALLALRGRLALARLRAVRDARARGRGAVHAQGRRGDRDAALQLRGQGRAARRAAARADAVIGSPRARPRKGARSAREMVYHRAVLAVRADDEGQEEGALPVEHGHRRGRGGRGKIVFFFLLFFSFF